MLIIYCSFLLVLGTEVSGQLFQGRFSFPIEFPGFSDPEAFGEEGFGFKDVQSRIADLMKDSKKPRKGVRTKVKTERKGKPTKHVLSWKRSSSTASKSAKF